MELELKVGGRDTLYLQTTNLEGEELLNNISRSQLILLPINNSYEKTQGCLNLKIFS